MVTKSLSKRLDQLEKGQTDTPFRIVLLDGTRDEVERIRAKTAAKASRDAHIIFVAILPYKGESVSQFRGKFRVCKTNL